MSIRDELAGLIDAMHLPDAIRGGRWTETVADHILARFDVIERPDGQRHADAIADTGDGYTTSGRGHLIQCLWCHESFFASTKAEAVEKYRVHERAMLAAANRAEAADVDR